MRCGPDGRMAISTSILTLPHLRLRKNLQFAGLWVYNFTIINIDLEGHEISEFRLFSQSEEAGAVGNQQWGLDVRYHQDNWYLYSTDHDNDYRFGTESEVEVRYSFVIDSSALLISEI